MSSLTHLAKLRGLMLDMESEVGLTDVSHLERDVMLACVELKDAATIVKTKDILAHRFKILISPIYFPRVEVSY